MLKLVNAFDPVCEDEPQLPKDEPRKSLADCGPQSSAGTVRQSIADDKVPGESRRELPQDFQDRTSRATDRPSHSAILVFR